ncbi:TMhelix containing protein [Vibrio phage 1.084.O._10N.261.49.F5]|nr:TMhelix containing protein [Vibrio phage 1.084.O._10N.261.49.F5]
MIELFDNIVVYLLVTSLSGYLLTTKKESAINTGGKFLLNLLLGWYIFLVV